MSNLIPYLPLDLTGKNPSNLVTNEEHLLIQNEGVNYPVVVLNNGGFYTQGLEVLDEEYQPLTPHVDYIATYKHADASNYTGLEICSALVFLNPSISLSVHVTAQMVGSDLAYSTTAKEDTLSYLKSLGTTKPIWSGFLGEELLWEDGELRRDRWALKGMEPFLFELENITKAMKEGNPEAEDNFRQYVLSDWKRFMDSWVNTLTSHLNDKNDPHDVVKAQLGLHLVENFPVSTLAQAVAGTHRESYLTPQRFYEAADVQAKAPLDQHTANKQNPHKVTAAQVGVHTQAQLDALTAQKLPVNGTVVNASGLVSYTETFESVFNRWKRISRTSSTDNETGDIYSDKAIAAELNTWSLDAPNNALRNTTNSSSLIGMISPEKFNDFVLEVELSSTSSDDDSIGLCIAYAVDSAGKSHTLTALRVLNGTAPLMIEKDSHVNRSWTKAVYGGLKWADGTIATAHRPGNIGEGWNKFPNGCRLKITRKDDIITVETSQMGETAYLASAKTVIDLSADPELEVFRGAQAFGYMASSQANSTWKVIRRPPDVKNYTRVFNDVRANISAEAFVSGIVPAARLALGSPSATKVFRGDQQWVDIGSIFDQYQQAGGANVIYVGQYSDGNTVLSNVRSTYANVNAYPVGTLVIWRLSTYMYEGGSNGAVKVGINPTRGIIRTTAGWQHLA